MITEFDLHEKSGIPLERIRAWLRQHGFGGRSGQRISVELEQKFLQAHAGPGPRATQPIPVVAARAVAAPPERTTAALDEATRQLRELQVRQASLETRNQALAAEVETARQAARQAAEAARTLAEAQRPVREEARSIRPRPAEDALPSLREALDRRGVGGKLAVEALRALVAQDGAAEALLQGLRVADAGVLEPIRAVCSVVTCREVASLRRYVVVPVSGAACTLCKGSDNRRWFRLMAARLEHAGRKRVLVVGGADDSRAELERLAREEPELRIETPTETRVDGTRARALVRSADVVAFWVSTDVSHAETQPFKDAARQDPGVVVAATAPGGRGVAALARAVLDALEVQAAKQRSEGQKEA